MCIRDSSLSFQKIGGLAFDIVKSILLLFLNSPESISIFFNLIRKVLVIRMQSSVTKLFSFKIVIVFFLFFARQLSISSETL